ncbi:PhoH family protein [Geoalkalibacter subterraneus]|uniref:PhoH n=1 Tax=Geoalkalibacter subterraneus TaxID=483547 RepID=A0A0B5FUH9_9BACT|nr:PhoH family protein [Geoalkalibacter subterraneus]AJF08299.1 PhoH [Geoalkalibacter subterraneus]
MAKKNYILDTNVLLHDSKSIFCFEDNTVILPLVVIEELDRFKKENSEIGRNARHVARELDLLRQKGKLTNGGVDLENGGKLRVLFTPQESDLVKNLPDALSRDTADNHILALASKMDQEQQVPTILVTKDINLRIKAHSLNLQAQDYTTDKVSFDKLFPGSFESPASPQTIDKFYREGKLSMADLSFDEQSELPFFYPHTCATLHCGQQSAIGRVCSKSDSIVPLCNVPKEGFWGISPRNREQKFALDLLADPQIHLVSLVGKAGTGKTLLAIAAGLHQVADQGLYRKLLVSRPVFPMGRDLGFLPGELDEKLAPWMQPIYDNVDLLLNGVPCDDDKDLRRGKAAGNQKRRRGHQELVEMGWMEIEALTYIRGRSIPKQYLIVDEAQNLTPHEVKTIITRAGEGTKIVLTGDPYQIDNPYVDAESNGLTYVVEKFKDSSLAGHITLSKGERSELAEAASNIL